MTITARTTELDASARLGPVYERFFEGPAIRGAAGLVGRALTPDSGYRGEVVYFTPSRACRMLPAVSPKRRRRFPRPASVT